MATILLIHTRQHETSRIYLTMSNLSLVKGKEYKVKDGDSILSIAAAAGITWQELARFNWGTEDPDQINIRLRDKVGCRKKTPDGKNFIFTSKDDPGIIHVPENVPPKTFSTSATHTV
ncbi:MAG: LysM peptidoglycan-binding domain-containing protein, partial [Bacteroidota bacterium]|nr:LysM peptidoglycan-binding domain-containing protein [Bacteroidota bacterium]